MGRANDPRPAGAATRIARSLGAGLPARLSIRLFHRTRPATVRTEAVYVRPPRWEGRREDGMSLLRSRAGPDTTALPRRGRGRRCRTSGRAGTPNPRLHLTVDFNGAFDLRVASRQGPMACSLLAPHSITPTRTTVSDDHPDITRTDRLRWWLRGESNPCPPLAGCPDLYGSVRFRLPCRALNFPEPPSD